jgi:hypothetical protein
MRVFDRLLGLASLDGVRIGVDVGNLLAVGRKPKLISNT